MAMLRVWGKWETGVGPFPLVGHLLDTAAVAWVAWEGFAPGLRSRLVQVLAPGDGGLARARFAVLAASHDLGKCSREFTGQLWSRHSGSFSEYVRELGALGLPMAAPRQRPEVAGRGGWWLRHEAVTGWVLHELTGLPGWARRVVMGHHGRYQPSGPDFLPTRPLVEMRERAVDPAWLRLQQELLSDVVAAVSTLAGADVSLEGWPDGLEKSLVPFVVAMTGLVCLCDWVASDEKFVAASPRVLLETGDMAGYLRHRVTEAAPALRGVLFGSDTPTGGFPDLFEGHAPRGAAQEWVAERRHGPGLVIVMAPMGEGKTEFALYRHTADASVAAGTPAGDGLFFGLPTMATADALFSRVQALWKGTAGFGRLSHGQAVLHDFYAASALRPLGNDEGSGDGLRPSDWCEGRHRGLWAPVTVGTCDQVLAAALDHRFLPVRLAALAGKHVVLDEVHTYDPFQHALLCRLLGWLGAFGCRVTLLSATLPRARVRELAAAWSRGWLRRPSSDAVEQVLERLPAELPYPAVVTVDDTLECEPLTAWRSFTLRLAYHRVPPSGAERTAATVRVLRQLRAEQPRARIGLIVNTVDRAIEVFEQYAATEPACLVHARMPGGQRAAATTEVEALVGKKAPAGAVFIAATQVAEAALDLDLDVLVTDLAPMAALLQRSGRQWRHSVNTGTGWSHPGKLAYREGDPVLHLLVPSRPDGALAASNTPLPYTAAELHRTWSHPACLAGGLRESFLLPQDIQPAIDAAHVSLEDLAADTAGEPAETADILRHLTAQLTQAGAAVPVGHEIGRIARRWRPGPGRGQDPFGRYEPDWSQLTAPRLWDEDAGAVTRLQERDQVQLLLYDTTGATPWAFDGDPAALTRDTDRLTLLAALSATVPVSGWFATQLRRAAAPHQPPGWPASAPPLLRGSTLMPVTALAPLAALDPVRGLIRRTPR